MMKPTISVVIRVFKSERFIGQAIESILAQTFQDYELIVVDDSSTDNTPDILQTYAQQDERIKVYRNKTNQGPVRTMNIGLRQARGELIAVQDADDISLPYRLEKQVEFLRANPNVALVGGGAYYIDEDGEIIYSPVGERKEGKGADEARCFLEQGHHFIHSSVMFRRACIEAIGFYDDFFLASHDYDMLIRMADTFDIVYHEEPMVKWRWLNSGVTGTKKQSQAAYAELARIRSRAKKAGINLNLQNEYDRLLAAQPITNGRFRNRPMSDTSYYYSVGVMLLNQGKTQKARRRFWQALKNVQIQKSDINLGLRTIVWQGLTFIPGAVNSKCVRALRRIM